MSTFALADVVPQEIADRCQSEWGDDYDMRLWCQKKQMAAKAELDLQRAERMYTANPELFGRESYCQAIDSKLDALFECGRGLQEADRQMTTVYKHIRRALPEELSRQVLQTQRDWLKIRDEVCKVKEWETGKSDMINADVIDCLTRVTDARTSQLNDVAAKLDAVLARRK